jgi:hypothetical protein
MNRLVLGHMIPHLADYGRSAGVMVSSPWISAVVVVLRQLVSSRQPRGTIRTYTLVLWPLLFSPM